MFHSHLITFFILILLHTVSKIGMYDLLYSVLYECVDTRSLIFANSSRSRQNKSKKRVGKFSKKYSTEWNWTLSKFIRILKNGCNGGDGKFLPGMGRKPGMGEVVL